MYDRPMWMIRIDDYCDTISSRKLVIITGLLYVAEMLVLFGLDRWYS